MLDLDKPITTRDGRPVRLICRDSLSNTGPLSVLIKTPSSRQSGTHIEELRSYRRDGRRHDNPDPRYNSNSDLINPRTKVKRWIVTFIPGTYTKPWKAYQHSIDALAEHCDPVVGLSGWVQAIEYKDVYEDEL